jgi:photosynthetic reaction center H subunit
MTSGNFDIALMSTLLFVAFFFALVLWLHRESKREGYPLEADVPGSRPRVPIIGFPGLPSAKTFKLAHGEPVVIDEGGRPDTRTIALRQMSRFPGTPFEPTGNPMADGVGPASYAERSDTPDLMISGANRLVPLRIAPDFNVSSDDPNPIGQAVVAGDNKIVGTVRDVWIDKAEYVIRYLEVEVPVAGGSRRVLVPINFTTADGRGRIVVRSIFAEHFAGVPGLKNPDVVTLLEEDKIMGYYGGGTLYASPERSQPLF